MVDDDRYLIEEINKGNDNAFIELYERYWDKLYFACYSRINSRTETEDILQELFVELWNNRKKIVIKTSVAAYLYTAVKYKIFRFIDSKNVRKRYLIRIENEDFYKSEHTTDKKLLFDELYYLIEQKIEKLPPKCKLIFKLSRFENFSSAEISSKLNLSERTVHNQITKANKILRLVLEKVILLLMF